MIKSIFKVFTIVYIPLSFLCFIYSFVRFFYFLSFIDLIVALACIVGHHNAVTYYKREFWSRKQ